MYRARWEIDVDARNPLEAARRARAYQHAETTATVFAVRRDNRGPWTRVDLSELEERADAWRARRGRRDGVRRDRQGRPSHAQRRPARGAPR
jgi:hypothetical protein